MPGEVARALVAADCLDRLHGRAHPLRPVFTVMLVTAPRVKALASRDIEHFQREAACIDFGKDVGKKRRGAGALDPRTLSELEQLVGARTEGALLLSPQGGRLRRGRLLDCWREAVGLGWLDRLWPADAPAELELMHQVNRALLTGRSTVNRGGNPKRVRRETLEARRLREQQVLDLAARLRSEWEERLEGVDLHGFRKTHRTWALAQHVDATIIDKQLGHASTSTAATLDVLRVAQGSSTGRLHYSDLRSRLIDAAASAKAVRALLDDALTDLERKPTLLLEREDQRRARLA